VLIGASVLTGAQVAVAHEVLAAIKAEAEQMLRGLGRGWEREAAAVAQLEGERGSEKGLRRRRGHP
jgi:hypothetical protein